MQHLAGSGFKSCQCETAARGALLGEVPHSHFNRLHIYCTQEQKTGDFSVFESIQTGSRSHPVSYCISIAAFYPRINQPGREADRLHPLKRGQITLILSYKLISLMMN
jgi:hypothetical protein